MSWVQSDLDLVPSLLDRLFDNDPSVSTEPPVQRSVRLGQMKESVKQDLEFLLNTKRMLVTIPEPLEHLNNSLLTYGLPDFTHLSLSKPADKEALHHAVEEVIRRFEPRLINVIVTIVEGRAFERGLKFRIDASLRVEPTPEAVSFDSVLDLTTNEFVLKTE